MQLRTMNFFQHSLLVRLSDACTRLILTFTLAILIMSVISTHDTPVSAKTSTITPVALTTGLMVFTRYDESDKTEEVYVMMSDGSNLHRLTNNKARDFSPKWSPDGKSIVFSTSRDETNLSKCKERCNYEVYVMDADGKNQRNLTKNKASDWSPSWSPDGKHIAFASNRNGNYEIYVMDADGKNQHNLTKNKANDLTPSWSPDSKQIAFASDRNNTKRKGESYPNYEIYKMNVDGSNQYRVTNDEAVDMNPDWSPDGKQIAFEYVGYGIADIWAIDADGKNPHNLTNSESHEFTPAWSPDSKQIAFSSDSGDATGYDIYLMDANGSNQYDLTKSATSDSFPDWQPLIP